MTELQQIIENAWDNRALLNEEGTTLDIRKVPDLLDKVDLRIVVGVSVGTKAF